MYKHRNKLTNEITKKISQLKPVNHLLKYYNIILKKSTAAHFKMSQCGIASSFNLSFFYLLFFKSILTL